jgi:hypothetical protein
MPLRHQRRFDRVSIAWPPGLSRSETVWRCASSAARSSLSGRGPGLSIVGWLASRVSGPSCAAVAGGERGVNGLKRTFPTRMSTAPRAVRRPIPLWLCWTRSARAQPKGKDKSHANARSLRQRRSQSYERVRLRGLSSTWRLLNGQAVPKTSMARMPTSRPLLSVLVVGTNGHGK